MSVAPRTLLLLLTLAAGAAGARAADLAISLPLGPWYRPGKYVPVRVTATLPEPGAYTLSLAADAGAGRTTLPATGGRLDAIVPFFVPGPRTPRLAVSVDGRADSAQGPEMRPLADADRLVGWTTPDEPFARQLTGPGARIVPVLLDPIEFLKTTPVAWETLDAVVLDADTATRLSEWQLGSLLASGVTVAVKTTQPPFPAWPWKRQGDYAVLVPELAGPATGAYFDAAYLPVADWQPGHPWPQRRRILVVAALCCLPLLAVALWRPRFAPAWAIVVATLLCLALVRWQRSVLAVRRASGEILVLHPRGVTQADRWTYLTSPVAGTLRMSWDEVTRPVASGDLPVTLVCDVGGHPAEFRVQVDSNRKVAFLGRMLGLQSPRTPPVRPVTSSLAPLVEAAYLGDSGRTLGELPVPANDDQAGRSTWNAVVVDRTRP